MSTILNQPFKVFPDVDGQPLESGYIYVGAENLDPTELANQIPLYWDEGLTLVAAQPLRTLGGFISNSGTPARVFIADGSLPYAIEVQNKNNTLVYGSPSEQGALYGDSGSGGTGGTTTSAALFDTFAALRLNEDNTLRAADVTGHTAIADGGQGDFWLDTSDLLSVDNNGTTLVDATSPRIGTWKRFTETHEVNAAWFNVVPGAWNQAGMDAVVQHAVDVGCYHFVFPAGEYDGFAGSYAIPANGTIKVSGEGAGVTRFKNTSTPGTAGDPAMTFDRVVTGIDPEDLNADVVMHDVTFESNSTGDAYSAIGLAGASSAQPIAAVARDCSFVNCHAPFHRVAGVTVKSISEIDCSFDNVVEYAHRTAGSGSYGPISLNVSRVKLTGTCGSAAGMVSILSGERDAVNISLKDIAVDVTALTGPMVGVNAALEDLVSVSVVLDNISKVSDATFDLTLLDYLDTTAGTEADSHGNISITGCAGSLGSAGGWDVTVEGAQNVSINGSQVGDLSLTEVFSTDIGGATIDALTIDAFSLAGLTVSSTTHPGIDSGAANNNYTGRDLQVAGSFAPPSLTLGGGTPVDQLVGFTKMFKMRATTRPFSGSATSPNLPAGWSIGETGEGTAIITHSLGTLDYTADVTLMDSNGSSTVSVSSITTNSFTISTLDGGAASRTVSITVTVD